MVTTTFGPHPIDQIRVGDKVLACDLNSGNWLPTPVLNTFQSDYRGFKTTIITADDHIESTYGHPFWVLRGKDLETRPLPEELLDLPRMISLPGRWVEAGHVQIGDQLWLVNGNEVSVEEVGTVPYTEKVFNLEIAEIHTYAVGKTGVLVHNSNCQLVDPGRGFNQVTPNPTGIVSQNGTRIKGYAKHGIDRAIGNGGNRAGTSPTAILDALKNPSNISGGVDKLGRPFETFTGRNARVVINSQTGQIISVNPLNKGGVR